MHDASLTDAYGAPAGVAREIVDTITVRTPGFSGWQQERWLYHCNDAAAFLGVVGWAQVADLPDAVQSLRADIAGTGWSEQQLDGYLHALSADGQPAAYLFRCLHCGEHLAYSDFT
ncbi:CbrC family protein [Sporichthya polymorpha]|uniref:CbrC family protein n=1 Tax=Sporichthya polymorpha TaxID=35751 RepID=UPI0003A03F44|nr:CbrC family protein [Sporichthya polymorpha]